MMTSPSWLHYTIVARPGDIALFPPPPTLADIVPALAFAIDCAKQVIKTPSGMEALYDSFDEDDRDKVSQDTILAALDALHVYIFQSSSEHPDVFHVPPKALGDTGIQTMNVFLSQSFTDRLPRGATASEWSLIDRQWVILVSWMIMHDMANAIGAFLFTCHMLGHENTPVSAAAFPLQEGRILNADYLTQEGKALWGERGWWVEYRLGGSILIDEWPHQQLIIYRPDRATCYPFTEQMIDQYLRGRGDPSAYNDLLPFHLDIKDAKPFEPIGGSIWGRRIRPPVGVPKRGPCKVRV